MTYTHGNTQIHCSPETNSRCWMTWRSDQGRHAYQTVRRFETRDEAEADFAARVAFHKQVVGGVV